MGLGIGVGLGLAGGIAAPVEPGNCGPASENFCSRGGAIGAATLGAGGVGAAIGALIKNDRWERRFARSAPAGVSEAPVAPRGVPALPGKNVIGLDVFGRTGLAGATYEQRLSPRVGIGLTPPEWWRPAGSNKVYDCGQNVVWAVTHCPTAVLGHQPPVLVVPCVPGL